MLLTDPAKRLSFHRYVTDGDLVIVYERHDNMKAIKACETAVLQNRFGVFKHSDWIGKPFGSKVFNDKGGFVYLLAPTPELWTLVLSHRTQILYIADISFIIMYLEIVPGCLVLESGTGSGSLTTSLARAVAPTGHVYTFDFHEQRAASAREDFERTGLSDLITVGVRDIQGEGFPNDFIARADSVFLDLPQPWLAIHSVAKMLKQDGILCSFSPCIEQVQRSCETLKSNFTDIRTFEVLLRAYEVREVKMNNIQGEEGRLSESLPHKRRHSSNEGSNGQEISSSAVVMARPSSEARDSLVAAYDSGEFFDALDQGKPGWQKWVKSFGKSINKKGKSLFMPLRVLITGKLRGPDIGASVVLLRSTGTSDIVASQAGFVTLEERIKLLREVEWDSFKNNLKSANVS